MIILKERDRESERERERERERGGNHSFAAEFEVCAAKNILIPSIYSRYTPSTLYV